MPPLHCGDARSTSSPRSRSPELAGVCPSRAFGPPASPRVAAARFARPNVVAGRLPGDVDRCKDTDDTEHQVDELLGRFTRLSQYVSSATGIGISDSLSQVEVSARSSSALSNSSLGDTSASEPGECERVEELSPAGKIARLRRADSGQIMRLMENMTQALTARACGQGDTHSEDCEHTGPYTVQSPQASSVATPEATEQLSTFLRAKQSAAWMSIAIPETKDEPIALQATASLLRSSAAVFATARCTKTSQEAEEISVLRALVERQAAEMKGLREELRKVRSELAFCQSRGNGVV